MKRTFRHDAEQPHVSNLTSRTEELQLMEQTFASGGFFQVPLNFFFIMTHEEAIVLAFLCDLSRMVRAIERAAGWFYCTVEQMQCRILVPERTQRRVLASLERKQLIQSERRGRPAKRYFSVDYNRLYSDIRDAMKDKKRGIS